MSYSSHLSHFTSIIMTDEVFRQQLLISYVCLTDRITHREPFEVSYQSIMIIIGEMTESGRKTSG